MPYDDLYKVLGVDKSADKKTIKKAYIKAAKRTHPDMEGGSKKKFALVKKSFDILSDDERREKYDATGDDSETTPDNERSSVINFISFSLSVVLNECAQNGRSPLEIEIVRCVVNKITANVTEAEKNIRITKNMLETDEKLLGRFTSDKENIFENIIRHRIKDMRADMAKMEDTVKNGNLAKELIKEIRFRKDAEEPKQNIGGWNYHVGW